MIKLGDKVKDTISGFAGIATGRCEYRWGCIQFLVSPDKLTKEGEKIKSLWFDEPQLQIVKTVKKRKTKSLHGPQENTPNREHP